MLTLIPLGTLNEDGRRNIVIGTSSNFKTYQKYSQPRNIVTLFKILDEGTWQGREGGVEYISTHYIVISHVEKNGEIWRVFLKVSVSWVMGWDYIKKMV